MRPVLYRGSSVDAVDICGEKFVAELNWPGGDLRGRETGMTFDVYLD